MPYMPPPTSWNPVPHIYFLTWKTGVHRHLSTVQRVESSPPMTSCSLCGALPFDVNLCRSRRLHEENNIIWGNLCMGSRGFLQPSSPLISKQGTIIPPSVCHVSLFTEKKYSSPFSPVHPEIHLPIPVYSYLSHISPHILSPFSP